MEAGRWLDGQIRELKAGLARRKLKRKRREEPNKGGKSKAEIKAELKERLRKLRLELFDKTVDQAQVYNLIEKLKMSQPALELVFPEEFSKQVRVCCWL